MTHLVKNVALLLVICLACAELVLRLGGVTPVPQPPAAAEAANLYVADPELGWLNRANSKLLLSAAGAAPNTVTVLPNGARATGRPRPFEREAPHRDLIFIGGSFTFGFGLNDHETYAWKVQTLLPDWSVHNFGVNGYGTCQSYILLKRLFERHRWHRPVVIYGFIEHHKERNVANYLWHYHLSLLASTGNISLPSCGLDGSGAIIINPARPYPQLPLRHALATISILEQLYLRIVGFPLAAQKQRIMAQLVRKLSDLTATGSGAFAVLLFDGGKAEGSDNRRILEQSGARVIDLSAAQRKMNGSLRQRDGHPSGKMTDLLAQEVVRFVGALKN